MIAQSFFQPTPLTFRPNNSGMNAWPFRLCAGRHGASSAITEKWFIRNYDTLNVERILRNVDGYSLKYKIKQRTEINLYPRGLGKEGVGKVWGWGWGVVWGRGFSISEMFLSASVTTQRSLRLVAWTGLLEVKPDQTQLVHDRDRLNVGWTPTTYFIFLTKQSRL